MLYGCQVLIFMKIIPLNYTEKNYSQIREQMSGPDLYVFTLKFLALKKQFFSLFRGQKFFFQNFYKKGIMQLFSADAIVFSLKK